MTTPMRPGLLDLAEAVSFTLAVVLVGALPPVSTAFGLEQPVLGATVGAGILGGLGLLAAFLAASFRSSRIQPAGALFLVGSAIWIVTVVFVDPTVGWRIGLATAWAAAAVLVAAAWFVLRGFPWRVFPALLLLVAGGVLASLAPTYPLLLAALCGGAAATFAVVLLVLRASSPSRQRSAAL